MKKSLLKLAGLFSIVASLFLVSCKNEPIQTSSATDTVLTLDKTKVKAEAYPGVNFISWSPVANANGYVLFIYEGGNFVDSFEFDYDDALCFIDTEIKDGVEYSYYVESTSKSSTGRAVVTQNSMSDKVTVKAIVPAYNVNPLELVNFEQKNGGNKDFVVNSDNIKIAKDLYNKISVSLPAKAYLVYNVMLTIDNEFETTQDVYTYDVLNNIAKNDVTLYTDFTVTQAGTYTANVIVEAMNEFYGRSGLITSTESVVVSALNGSGALISSAEYKDFGKTARIEFSKFTLNNGTDAPIEYYKLYRSEKASKQYTLVDSAIKATDSTKSKFFVDDVIEDNTKNYVYTLVVTDGTNYKANPSTKELNKFVLATSQTATVIGAEDTYDADNVANDIKWTITLPSDNVAITGVYKLAKPTTDNQTPFFADFDTTANLMANLVTENNTNGETFYLYTKDEAVDTNVYLLVTTKEDNKEEAYVISSPVKMTYGTFVAPTISIEKYDNTLTFASSDEVIAVVNDVIINVNDTNSETNAVENYEYKLYKAISNVETDVSSITWKFDTANWKEVATLNMEKDDVSEDVNYTAIYKEVNLADGVYAYKVVKTDKVTGKSKAKIEYVQITATEDVNGIEYEPFISAQWDDDALESEKGLITVTFKKDTSSLIPVLGKLEGYDYEVPVQYDGSEKPEAGVKYTLYIREQHINQNLADVVWTKLDDFGTPAKNKPEADCYIYDLDENKDMQSKNIKDSLVDSLTYEYEVKDLDTSVSYRFMVVASKDNVKNYYSNTPRVDGKY